MRYVLRWWETLGKAERIVALSIGLSAPVAIINSTVWAIAVMYMAHEKARVDLEKLRVAAGGETGVTGQARSTVLDATDRRPALGQRATTQVD